MAYVAVPIRPRSGRERPKDGAGVWLGQMRGQVCFDHRERIKS